MFQWANKLHTDEQDNKVKCWAVFLNIYLNGLTPQDEHSSYECTRNNHFFGARTDRYALQHNKIWRKRIDDINIFLLLLLFISLAEFSLAHRQHTWIDIEMLIWDLFSWARLELLNAFVRWKVVATEGCLLSMYLL